MALHVQFRNLRDERERVQRRPLYELSVEDARRVDLEEIQKSAGLPEHVEQVENLAVPTPDVDIPIRIYRPRSTSQLPALVYFFGGGWTLGNLETSDAVCRYLANRSDCAVIAVQYRLAPENKFPAAVNDCYAATAWIADHAARLRVDPRGVAVGGDSAGANLAAAVTLLARDTEVPPLVFQLLVCPIMDYMADTQSMSENDDPHLFNRKSVAWYWHNYLTTESDAENPLAAPLRASDFSRLPPGLVITAQYDPLRDEGEAYARCLMDAGVDIELIRYEDMAHGFFTMIGAVDAARAALDQAADRLRSTFEKGGIPVSRRS